MNTLRPTAANESGIQATHRERPIIMSGDNPKLILEGRKTQTRRIIQPWQPDGETVMHFNYGKAESLSCPYGRDGDRLWVREKCWIDAKPVPQLGHRRVFFDDSRLVIHENGTRGESPHPPLAFIGNWKQTSIKRVPSIHMPQWASRITLEITKVRVERLQDISREDAKSEGMLLPPTELYPDVNTGDKLRECYRRLWDSLHGKGAWDENPWVWVIEFGLSPKESSTATLTTKKPK